MSGWVDAGANVGAALAGAVVGAGIAWFVGRKQHSLDAVFAMHREFNSPEMAHSRTLAWDAVKHCLHKNYDDLRRELDREKLQHVWNVLYFYQRLWLAIKYDAIYSEYVPDLFGEHFVWWYLNSYQSQLVGPNPQPYVVAWQVSDHIHRLWEWIESNAKAEEFEAWTKRAKDTGPATA